ncbi:sulfatase [Thermostilla marina]
MGYSAPPNVLFIAVDDLNTCVEGMHGETTVPTPNIARLAQRGVLFNNAHCAAPACNPSRTSVLTGLAPTTSGVYYNWQDWRENRRLASHPTLPERFRQAGYRTLGGGKIYHAATLSREGYTGYLDPRPWDAYFPSKERQMPQEVLPPRIPMNSDKAFYGGRFDWAPLPIEPDEMADAKVVRWAVEQLAKRHDRPLFLAVGIYRPHIPWYTPQQYFRRHPLEEIELPETIPDDLGDVPEAGRKMARRDWHRWIVDHGKWKEAVQGYYASVSFADEMVGRLIDALDASPIGDNTIVVLWADHGYHLGQKEHWEKFALWEQTTRVPLIIVAPGVSVESGVCNAPVSLLDIYPTLVELCGLSPVAGLDGESLVPWLRDPDRPSQRAIVTTQGRGNHAVRTARWRYIRYADGSEELYDQIADPKDFHNLAEQPDLAQVKRELGTWLPKWEAEPDPAVRSRTRKSTVDTGETQSAAR